MLMKIRRKLTSKKGQGMTEYIIIVALIAIAAIGVLSLFGDNIRALFGASSDALAGDQNAQVHSETYTPVDKTLQNFTNTTEEGPAGT